jgi:N-methylhydantoinase A/oxoprolinase/acetone carboxylase beta subunit
MPPMPRRRRQSRSSRWASIPAERSPMRCCSPTAARRRERQGAHDPLESRDRHRQRDPRGARRTPAANARAVSLVCVSTTLATNAVVENRFSPVCTLLIGFDDAMVGALRPAAPRRGPRRAHRGRPRRDRRGVGAARRGGRAARGRAVRVARRGVRGRRQFSVRNPAHELRARQIIRALSPKPVTCAHELSRSSTRRGAR